MRREFTWLTITLPAPVTRYCTVTWMRTIDRVSAFAYYRDVIGVDSTFVGMAQGKIGGPLHLAGESKAQTVLGALGREATTQRDSIDAVVALAVLSLEQAVGAAVAGAATEHEHPWLVDGRAEYEERQARKARPA